MIPQFCTSCSTRRDEDSLSPSVTIQHHYYIIGHIPYTLLFIPLTDLLENSLPWLLIASQETSMEGPQGLKESSLKTSEIIIRRTLSELSLLSEIVV